MKITCPICRAPQRVRRGKLAKHRVLHRLWSEVQDNGLRTAVDLKIRCSGSEASVKIDRRRA